MQEVSLSRPSLKPLLLGTILTPINQSIPIGLCEISEQEAAFEARASRESIQPSFDPQPRRSQDLLLMSS